MSDFRIVLSSCAGQQEARRIAYGLVERRLAACVNILTSVHSVYRWKGKVESAEEIPILIKTEAAHLDQVREYIATLHSYEVPEFLVLTVTGGSEPYLAWLADSLM